MKKLFVFIFFFLSALTASSQDVTLFFLNDGSFRGFYDAEIDSIVYSHLDADSVWHDKMVMQEIWSVDSVSRIPLEMIDSICHKVPEPEYKSEVVRISEQMLDYVTSVEGMSITFSPDMPADLRPHEGDILLYEGSCDWFPEGFAGRVLSEGTEAECESVEFGDVYDKLVFFGRYAIVDNPNDGGASSCARRVVKRAKGYAFDNGLIDKLDSWLQNMSEWTDTWRMNDGKYDNLSCGSISRAVSIDFKKIDASLAANVSVTPIVSIQFAYDGYILNPTLFYKCTSVISTETKVKFSVKGEVKPDQDSSFWGASGKLEFERFTEGYQSDANDDENSQSCIFVDETFYIPECPLLFVGFDAGLFMEPKVEAEIAVGGTFKSSKEKTIIYNLEKDNWLHLRDDMTYLDIVRGNIWEVGEVQEGEGPSTFEFEPLLEGSLKGSCWVGVLADVYVGLGAGKKMSVREEAKFRFGPYIEANLMFDCIDLVADQSFYNSMESSKLKYGLKLGVDLSLKAGIQKKGDDEPKYGINWKQFAWSPKSLLREKNVYLLPAFEAPEYYVEGSSLFCSSKVSRQTVNNSIGFGIVDEHGNEVKKFQAQPYAASHDYMFYKEDEDDMAPYIMNERFDGLDFAHHLYTIVPKTRMFELEKLEFSLPEEYQTLVTCPDSHHPHLIDLGLPSGTKWSCCNVYADNPKESGGYYQWGHSLQTTQYVESGFNFPALDQYTIQGTQYDAATENCNDGLVTPDKLQFEELLDNCELNVLGSDWYPTLLATGEGLYARGSNGNLVYLPFGGYMDGKKISYTSKNMGYYMLSNFVDSEKSPGSVIKLRENRHTIEPASWYGYSVRPILPYQKWDLDLSSNSIKFGEVAVGRSATEDITITNPTNAAISFIITNEQKDSQFSIAPQMDIYTLGAHQPMTLSVNYNPTKVGQCVEWLVLSSPNGNNKTILSLSGTGIQNNAPVDGAVDLGLPSGTLWAECNVGATSKEQRGDLFAWAETQGYSSGKTSFSWSGYKYCNRAANKLTKYCTKSYYGNNGFTDNRTVLEYGDDAAAANLTGNWRMPTVEEWNELATNCTWTSATVKGVNGCLITGKNGNTLFLPAAGYRDGASLYDADEAYYWTSSLDVNSPDDAWFFYFGDGHRSRYDYYRSMGRSVRPVYDESMGRDEAEDKASAVGTRHPASQPEPVRLTLPDGKVIAIQCRSSEDN